MKTRVSLEEVYAPVQAELAKVPQTIVELLATPNELSREVIRYFFSSKGKFLRPALCLLGAGLNGRLTPTVISVAAAFEIFHSATLIHDDIVDSAYIRRHMPTVNVKWGPQLAVLIGDFLHDRALVTFFEAGNDRLISLFLNTACEVCDGEILEFKEKDNFDLTEELYLTIIQKKTASLLSASLEAGAILSELPLDETVALKNYGTYFGMAFQIVDDCLDFMGEENEFGKTLGLDCDAGVLTLPMIRLLALIQPAKKSEVYKIFKSDLGGEKLATLNRLIREYGSIDYAYDRAREFTDKARLELACLRDYSAKRSLELLLDYVLERPR